MQKELTIFIVCIIVSLVIVGYGANEWAKTECLESYSNYQPQYGFFSECRVMWKGVLTPTDIVRELQ